MDRFPVAEDYALKAHLTTQYIDQIVVIFMHLYAVQSAVTDHERLGAAVDLGLIDCQESFYLLVGKLGVTSVEEGPAVQAFTGSHQGISVTKKMFGACDYAMFGQAPGVGGSQFLYDFGIGTIAFVGSSPAGILG